MADEFQTGICSGNWWNSTRNNGSDEASLPCSSAINDVGSFGWPSETMETKVRSCEDSVSVTDSSIVFQDGQKPQGSDSISGGGSSILMDSTLRMMGYGLSSSPTMDWNQASLSRSGGRAESNFLSMLQEDSSSKSNYHQEMGLESAEVQKVWSPKFFSGGGSSCGDSSVNAFKRINEDFAFDQHRLSSSNSSGECTVTCQGLPTSFMMDSVSYGYPSTLVQGLYEPEFQPQQSPYENRTMNYPSQSNYLAANELSPSWTKFPQFLNSPSTSNKALFLNAHAPAPAPSMNNVRLSSTFFPSSQARFGTQTFEEKPNVSNNLTHVKPKTEDVHDAGSLVKKGSSEPALKRPRIETPSPLPTFKVRKEKLGDRITALQQVVSPFGKTDTASVLYEAIEYIKFLHDQVGALSAPYMKNGAPIQHQQNSDKLKGTEGPQQDLRSRGLCLVPISSTFAVTNEITTEFWMPTFGGTFR